MICVAHASMHWSRYSWLPRSHLTISGLDSCHGARVRREQAGVDHPPPHPLVRGDIAVGILVHRSGGQELLLHPLELGDDLVVPRRPLDLGHRVRAVAPGDLVSPAVDDELQVRLAERQEFGCQSILREVGETQVGLVGAAVIGELGAGVAVQLLADVQVGLRVRDVVVDARELLIVVEIHTQHEHEVVGHDLLLEVGPRLANGVKLVQTAVVLLGHGRSPCLSISTARLADRLDDGKPVG